MINASEARIKSDRNHRQLSVDEELHQIEKLIQRATKDGEYEVMVNHIISNQTDILLHKLGYDTHYSVEKLRQRTTICW